MKVAIVTGCSAGIGVETVRGLAGDDSYEKIVCAVRNPKKMSIAMVESGYSAKMIAKCEIVELNLASLNSVDQFIERLKDLQITRIDRLVLNAGTKDYSRNDRHTTVDGIDEIWQINYFANFYLVCAISPILTATPGSRVVLVSSVMHWLGSSDAISNLTVDGATQGGLGLWSTYRDSKFAITVLGSELRGRGIDTIVVNPGAVASDIWRNWYSFYLIGPLIRMLVSLLFLSCLDGAQTTLYACRDLEGKSEQYLAYLSPYGHAKSRWEIISVLTDMYWFWIHKDQRRFVGRCCKRAEDQVVGSRVWRRSIEVISKTSLYRADICNSMRHYRKNEIEKQ